MSAPAPAAAGRARSSPASALGLVLTLLVVGLGAWAIWAADPPIDRSVIGMAGLAVAIDDLEVIERPVRERARREAVGLSILPLYDNDPGRSGNDRDNRDLRQELRPVNPAILLEKLARVPTLVVLPKWRLGALTRAVFHPSMLLDPDAMNVRLIGRGISLRRDPPVFAASDVSGRLGGAVTLYAAQTLALAPASGCSPVVWSGADRFGAVLVARCERDDTVFHVLSDPDLMNNHGLGLGANVEFARALVAALRPRESGTGARKVVLDLHAGQTWPRRARGDERGRTLDDLLRFFEGPFALVWLAVGLLAALSLWRGAVRFGPVDRGRDGFHEASRTAMIAADARILRASGAAAPLLARHAQDRVEAAARALFGRSARAETLLSALARRAPDKARALRDALAEVTEGSAAQASWLARFDAALAAARDEFSR